MTQRGALSRAKQAAAAVAIELLSDKPRIHSCGRSKLQRCRIEAHATLAP
jgi:hypothetical protein